MAAWLGLPPFGSFAASGSAFANEPPSVLSPLRGLNLSSVPVASASLRLATEDTIKSVVVAHGTLWLISIFHSESDC